jgi:cell division protein FtsW
MVYRWPEIDFSYYFLRQVLNIVIGLVFMAIIAMIPVEKHLQWAPIYLVSVVLLLVTVFFFPPKGGSHRWIDLGFYDLQPSELAKFVIILFIASYYDKRQYRANWKVDIVDKFLIPFGWILLITFLIFREPDLSTSMIVLVIGVLLMFVAGLRYYYFFLIAGLGIIALVAAFQFELLKPYQLERITGFFDFFKGKAVDTQVQIGIDAISSGGVLGGGLAMGDYKYLLPVQFTDFIFAILGEELGFIGMAFLLILYYLMCRSLIHAAVKGVNRTAGKLIIVGYAYLVLIQVIINVGVVLGVFPPTGIPLPFISYGGSSMLAYLGGFGLVISVITHDE